MGVAADANVLTTLVRGLKVLEAFSEVNVPQSAADIARVTGLPRATVGRILSTLLNSGYVSFESKRYELTPKILLLSQAYLSSNNLPDLVQPTLEHITEVLDEASSLTVLSKTEVIYIARSARKSLSINKDSVLIGTSLPAYCTSTGRVLLAALPLEQQRATLQESELKAHTEYTVTDINKLMQIIAQAGKDGYALSNQEVELGICSIAAAVRNRRGEVIGAINISTHTLRNTPQQAVDKFLPHLLSACKYLEKLM